MLFPRSDVNRIVFKVNITDAIFPRHAIVCFGIYFGHLQVFACFILGPMLTG